jgi:hypothetical protein
MAMDGNNSDSRLVAALNDIETLKSELKRMEGWQIKIEKLLDGIDRLMTMDKSIEGLLKTDIETRARILSLEAKIQNYKLPYDA